MGFFDALLLGLFDDDEKYAWREWCEDGSEFDIYPEFYETEADYLEDLNKAKKNKI